MRILLIEDDASMNEALTIFLKKAGYTVLQAYNAREAWQYLGKEPDAIIADIQLPGISGIDFCRKLLSYKRIPVIFLTAKDEEEDILAGYEAGCEYSGRFYTAIPEVGNRHSGIKETAIPI